MYVSSYDYRNDHRDENIRKEKCKVVQYSMLKNQCDVQCHHGIGRVVNELIDKSANLHSFINRANYGESYQPHPTEPNLLQLSSKPTTVVSIAEGDV